MHVLACSEAEFDTETSPQSLPVGPLGEALVIPGSYTGTCITAGGLFCH